MKRKGTKLLLLISVLAVAVLVSVFAITASADDTVNYYRYSYDGTTWTTVNSTMTSDPGNHLVSTANTQLGAANGNKIYIQLLSDIVTSASVNDGWSGNLIYLSKNENQLYFDLNGFDYHCIGESNKNWNGPYRPAEDSAFLMRQWNQQLHIYSSQPGGRIFVNKTDSSGNIVSGTLVGSDNGPYVCSNAENGVFIGAYNGYSGDNLTVYASRLAFMFNAHNRAATLTIDGGTYYQNTSTAIDDFGYISIGNSKGEYLTNGKPHVVKNANFILNDANFLSTSYDYTPGSTFVEGLTNVTYDNNIAQEITVDNCTIQTTGNFIGKYWTLNARANVTNSTVLCNVDNGGTGSVTFGSGVSTTDDSLTNINTDGLVNAVTNKEVNLNKVVVSVSYSGNSATISERTEPLNYSISRMYTLLSNVQTVNWKLGEDTITEYYYEGVTPSCPINIPANGKYYQFVCSEDITPAVKGTSVSYEFSQKSTVKILTNISLYRDFVYNIYIPTDAVDEGGIKSVTIEGSAVDFSTLDKKVVSKRNCYVATVKIPAANGNTGYPVVIETNGYNGNVITDNYTVSIPKYANAVLNGDFGDEAKELVKSTLAYIIAAYNYAHDDENHGIVLPDGYTTPVVHGSQMTGLSGDAFLGAQLEITSNLIFRFFTNSVNVSETPIKLTYYVNGVLTEKTLTPEEVKVLGDDQYFDLEVNIFDLRYNITAECSNGSRLDYRLSNYIYAMKQAYSGNAEMAALMNTLYEYAIRANLYGRTEPDTPIADVIKVNGNTVTPNSYEILLSADNDEQRAAAAVLQNQIREKTGYTLQIVTKSTGKNAIKILVSTGYSNDFEVSVSGNDLLVKSAFNSFVSTGATSFALDYIATVIEEYNFTSIFKTTEYKAEFVTYKDFGAKGDGVTDDYSAMSAAHNRANGSGYLTVKVNDGSYNVGKHTPISVKTSVDFTGATIIIDDKDFTVSQSNIFTGSAFKVVSDYIAYVHQSDALVSSVNTELLNPDSYNSSTTTSATQIFGENYLNNIRYSGSKVMLVIEDKGAAQKVFIRFPANASDGVDPKELIIVNADGTLDKSAGLVLTYSEVDKVTEYRIDDAQITISGGKFITRANNFTEMTSDKNAYYFGRGIDIYRSNTVIDGIDHLIVDEVDSSDYRGSSPYGGFISTNNCSDVTIKNSTLQAHRQYRHPTNGTWAGTYDIGASLANNITYQNVKQRGFDPNNVWNVYNEDGTLKTAGDVHDNIKTWGIMGTNYCKNFTWDTCTLSRFDAHAGVYNATIKDSKVNEIALIGGGTANIINTHVYSRQNNILQLRGDYGSTWNGDLNITDVTFHNCKTSTAPWMAIMRIQYYNHDFGYQTYLPRNINISNLDICNGTGCDHPGHQTTNKTTSGGGGLYIFEAYNYLYSRGSGNTSYFDFNADYVPVNSDPSAGDNYDTSGKTYKNINKFILPETVSITTNKATDYITFYGIKFGTVGGFKDSTAFEKTWKDGLKTTVTYKTSDGGKTYKK